MKRRKRRGNETMRMSVSKKLLIVFTVFAALLWLSLRLLESWIAALTVTVVLGALFYFTLCRMIVKPLQELTMSIIESRPTEHGFEYKPVKINTADELELLNDAFRRMANDLNHTGEGRNNN